MPAPPRVREDLKELCENPASKYFHCTRECEHVLLQELRDFGWYEGEDEIRAKVNGRVKSSELILEKLDRNGAIKVSTLPEIENEISDIVGARVILDYLDHAERMASRLENLEKWDVVKAEPSHHRTGYRAVRHIDVEVDLGRHGKMRSEIQVRTRLQEAWGIWSHPIYEVMRNRSLKDPPASIIQRLSDISVSLQKSDETVDRLREEFDSWKEQP